MNSVLIWGAGEIDRGFVAEAFRGESCDLTFIDEDVNLVPLLNRKDSFSVINTILGNEPELVEISNYTAISITETSKIKKVIAEINYLGICVIPEAYSDLVPLLSEGIESRASFSEPLDILFFTDTKDSAKNFDSLLREHLSDKGKRYLNEYIGLVESVTIRSGFTTPERFKSLGNLAITKNGFPYIPVEKAAFKGAVPAGSILRPVDHIEAEKIRRFFTYDMAHAVCTYSGLMFGCETVSEAADHHAVSYEISEALKESTKALVAEFDFDLKEMDEWNNFVMGNLANPLMNYKLEQLGKDPVRKLANRDQLIGPALLSKKHGQYPYFITKAIAQAFIYRCPEDISTLSLQIMLQREGFSSTLEKVADLKDNPEIVSMAKQHFKRLQINPTEEEQPKLIEFYKRAYSKGFEDERDVHGCAQCTLTAMFEVTGQKNNDLYRAASAFAGGVGLSGDGICGGYAAGILWMGTYAGRRLQFMNGDKEEQYKSFEMAQKLRNRFVETYGSIICGDIHKTIFGRAFTLLTKAVRNEFEAAGAHTDRCTSVVAIASLWTAEILIEEGLLSLDEIGISGNLTYQE